jgi:ABC-2 type transport system permease protein
MNTDLFGPDSDFVTYHSVVSTSPESDRHLARRSCKREWQQNGRRYFEYSMGSTKNSGLLQLHLRRLTRSSTITGTVVRRPGDLLPPLAHLRPGQDAWRIQGEASTTTQRITARISSTSFESLSFRATAALPSPFPNTVPYSEGIGFIGRLERPDDIDFTWFVTAHELAHQWWGHQLVGGHGERLQHDVREPRRVFRACA